MRVDDEDLACEAWRNIVLIFVEEHCFNFCGGTLF